MKTRLLTAAVGVPLALAVLIGSVYWPLILYGALFILCMIGIHEALKTSGADKARVVYGPCFLYGAGVMLYPLWSRYLASDGYDVLFVGTLVYLLVMFGILIKKHAVLRIESLCTAMILTMFVSFPFMVVELIFETMAHAAGSETSYLNGVIWVAYCIGLAWIADAGAYFVGRAFGKHKLAPVISPKKTIEGSVGGFVTAMLVSTAAAWLYADVLGMAEGRLHYVNFIIISAVCVIMSMFGDISFSAVKRQYGIKDFGNLLPGHGGVLDRFDSVLFVAPTFYILNFLLPIV